MVCTTHAPDADPHHTPRAKPGHGAHVNHAEACTKRILQHCTAQRRPYIPTQTPEPAHHRPPVVITGYTYATHDSGTRTNATTSTEHQPVPGPTRTKPVTMKNGAKGQSPRTPRKTQTTRATPLQANPNLAIPHPGFPPTHGLSPYMRAKDGTTPPRAQTAPRPDKQGHGGSRAPNPRARSATRTGHMGTGEARRWLP